LGERLEGYRERADALDAALQPAGVLPDTVPDPLHRQALTAAIRAGQAQGDVVRQKSETDRRLRELEGQLALALSELGLESEQALRRSQPVLDAQIAQAKQDLTEIEAQLTKWRDESERVARDLDGQRLRQRQLAAEGEVVTAETLRQARAKRSEEWTAIRRTYIDKTSGTDQLALGFDATKALPETFESAVGRSRPSGGLASRRHQTRGWIRRVLGAHRADGIAPQGTGGRDGPRGAPIGTACKRPGDSALSKPGCLTWIPRRCVNGRDAGMRRCSWLSG
jgi:hypothetical protein